MKRLEVLEDLNGEFVGEAEGEAPVLDVVSTLGSDYMISLICHSHRPPLS